MDHSARLVIAFLFTAMVGNAAHAQSPPGAGPLPLELFEKRQYQTADDLSATLPYRLLIPQGYNAQQKYPLVLFLHGAGERGTDNEKQLTHGMGLFLSDSMRQRFPCFVVVPQCPEEAKWVEVPWSDETHTMPAEPSRPLRMAVELIEALQSEFSIDDERLIITGLSMGGFGTWDAIQRYPQKFAAAIPVCGGGDPALAPAIAQVPVWAFHGAKDTAVKVQRSRDMVAALQREGGKPRYSEFPNVGHDSWNPAYSDAELFTWMFAQKLSQR